MRLSQMSESRVNQRQPYGTIDRALFLFHSNTCISSIKLQPCLILISYHRL